MKASKTSAKPPATPPADTIPIEVPELRIEQWAIERLKPYETNPRKNDKVVDKIVASIREFGFSVPILAVGATGEVIDGHLRLKGALQLGLKIVPVIPCDGWSEAQIKAFRLMVNRSVNWATWDADLLRVEFGKLKSLGFDVKLTGFDQTELVRFVVAQASDDDLPPVPEAPISRTGDLWICGDHRLLCGSCLDAAAVARLVGDRKPTMLITDPPYGVKLDMEWRDRAGHNEMGPASRSYMKIANAGAGMSGDTIADWSPAFELVPSLDIAYVWHASSHTCDVYQGLERIGFQVRQQIIWRKTVAAMSRQVYQWIHEPCWYAVRTGRNARWIGGRNQTTIWDAASPKHIMSGSKEEKLAHPTQKPIELMRRPILNHGDRGDHVYEPFGGSGTTMAACETAGRLNCSMEIEPRFVDVIVTRWQRLTGREATLDGDGRTFAEISGERKSSAPAAA